MNFHFQAHLQIRQNLLKLLKENTLEDLLYIPEGFNNNMYWNIAHAMATQQLLHYYLSGNAFRIDVFWIDQYKKGTLPNLNVDIEEAENLRFLLTETSTTLMKDFDENLFKEYTHYATSFGTELKNIKEAITFNNIHEGLHLGYAMSLKRAIIGEKN